MKFHDKRFAREYDTRLTEENYPGLLLDKISEKLISGSTVIDCGAGSGFFALPLGQMGYRVTAVEPSVAMLDILRTKQASGLAGRSSGALPVSIINQSWEDYPGPGTDYCICVHAIYPMGDPKEAIVKMHRLCNQTILIARDIEQPSATITDKIRNMLKIEASYKRNVVDVKEILSSSGISFQSEKFTQSRISRFADIDREADYYLYHLKLPQSYLSRVKEVLKNLAQSSDTGLQIEQVYHDIMYIF